MYGHLSLAVLKQAVADGKFRADLYHRLNVVHLELPPLRERPGDVPALLEHFLARSAAEIGVEPKTLEPGVADWLAGLPWPGNVRELENLCRRLVVMAPGATIHFDDLPEPLRPVAGDVAAGPVWEAQFSAWVDARLAAGATGIAGDAQETIERLLIDAALKHARGQRGEAARLLGWGRNTLARKRKGSD